MNTKFIIIDVGAASGKMTKRWLERFQGKAQFYCIEPHPTSFNNLSTFVSENTKQTNKIFVFNIAISNQEGKMPFYVSKYANCSSLLPIVTKNVKLWKPPAGSEHIDFADTKTIEVTVKRLDTFLKENNLEKSIIDFIKIDTQGNDFNVVKSLGDLICNVKEIMLEVQIVPFEYYKGQSKKIDLVNYMCKNGFEISRKSRQSNNQEENLWFTNKRFKAFLNLI
jgi:FkbM family methyltransferase